MLLPAVAKHSVLYDVDCDFLELCMYWGGHVHLALEDVAANLWGLSESSRGVF